MLFTQLHVETSAVRTGDATASLSKLFLGQNWLDLGKFSSWIWAKL